MIRKKWRGREEMVRRKEKGRLIGGREGRQKKGKSIGKKEKDNFGESRYMRKAEIDSCERFYDFIFSFCSQHKHCRFRLVIRSFLVLP